MDVLSIEVSNTHHTPDLLVKRKIDREERHYPDKKRCPATEKNSYALLTNTQLSKDLLRHELLAFRLRKGLSDIHCAPLSPWFGRSRLVHCTHGQ